MDDTFLARWLEDELTAEEQAWFERHPDFQLYAEIAWESEQLGVPYLPSLIRSEIMARRNTTRTRTVRRQYVIAMMTAAAVLLLGAFYFVSFLNTQTYRTSVAEKQTITLPDGTRADLNAGSILTLRKNTYDRKRQVHLRGEGFFDVQSGSPFTVNTAQGRITVHGTQFNVWSRDAELSVACREGTVRVIAGRESDPVELRAGMQVRVQAGVMGSAQPADPESIAGWRLGESRFVSAPLTEVLAEFLRQYDVTVDTGPVDMEQRFTGAFVHDDIDQALQMVFAAMNIRYTKRTDGRIVLEE